MIPAANQAVVPPRLGAGRRVMSFCRGRFSFCGFGGRAADFVENTSAAFTSCLERNLQYASEESLV